jgi:hypothetical protein
LISVVVLDLMGSRSSDDGDGYDEFWNCVDEIDEFLELSFESVMAIF